MKYNYKNLIIDLVGLAIVIGAAIIINHMLVFIFSNKL